MSRITVVGLELENNENLSPVQNFYQQLFGRLPEKPEGVDEKILRRCIEAVSYGLEVCRFFGLDCECASDPIDDFLDRVETGLQNMREQRRKEILAIYHDSVVNGATLCDVLMEYVRDLGAENAELRMRCSTLKEISLDDDILTALDLPARTQGALARNDINTVRELIACSSEDLRVMKGISLSAVCNIVEELAAHGLRLKKEQ